MPPPPVEKPTLDPKFPPVLLDLIEFTSNGLLTIEFNQLLLIPEMITLMEKGRLLESLDAYINEVLNITMIVLDQDLDLRF